MQQLLLIAVEGVGGNQRGPKPQTRACILLYHFQGKTRPHQELRRSPQLLYHQAAALDQFLEVAKRIENF